MPEAPDLEVVREFLAERILGVKVASASVIKPSVLRPLAGDLEEDIPGRKLYGRAAAGQVPADGAVREADVGDQPDAHRRFAVLPDTGADGEAYLYLFCAG